MNKRKSKNKKGADAMLQQPQKMIYTIVIKSEEAYPIWVPYPTTYQLSV